MHAWLLAILLSFQAFSQHLIVEVLPESSESSINFSYPKPVFVDTLRKRPDLIAPIINAQASIAIDKKTQKILYNHNAYKRLPIASLTKIMTALVVREHATLDEVVIISKEAALTEGSKMKLLPGEKITVKDLLKGMLINSGNDAAVALAEYVGEGHQNKFIKLMNNKTQDLNLIHTHFANPMGFDDRENYSTGYELLLIIQEALKDPFIKKTINTEELELESISGQKHTLKSTNKILGGYLNITGGKTGTTDQAGASLIAISNKDDREIIGIVLNSPNRFSEMKVLLDWCYRAYIF